MSTVVPSMTRTAVRTTALRTSAVLGAVLVVAGCAARTGGGTATPSSPAPQGSDVALPADGGLVLQVTHVGGFVMPPTTVTRIPLVSIYADGRVITEGPVVAIHPGPALPNLQVARVAPERVEELVRQALDAGVGEEFDHGMPPVADAPSTRFTVVTADGVETTEVAALAESTSPGGPTEGLSREQLTARSRMQDLLEQLTPDSSTEPYAAETVAAVATAWTDPGGGMPAEAAALPWPGPPLPGEPLPGSPGLSCLTAAGAEADAVLGAAGEATTLTPWTTDDGTLWAVTLRPLLPHERSCADLPGA